MHQKMHVLISRLSCLLLMEHANSREPRGEEQAKSDQMNRPFTDTGLDTAHRRLSALIRVLSESNPYQRNSAQISGSRSF